MRKHVWLFLLLLVFVACGDDKEVLPPALTTQEGYDVLFEQIAPLIKDTTGFERETLSTTDNNGGGVAAIKDNKLWIGLFRNDYSVLEGEWISSFNVPEDTKATRFFNFTEVFNVDNGYACFIALHNVVETFSGYSVVGAYWLHLLDDGTIQIIHQFENGDIYNLRYNVYGDNWVLEYRDDPNRTDLKRYLLTDKGETIASSITITEESDNCFITGLKDEKLVVSVYDKDNRSTKRWYSDTPIDRTLNIHQGYGEYKTYEVDSIRLENILATEWGYVAEQIYIAKDVQESGTEILQGGIYILNNQGGINLYEESDNYDYSYINWHEGSVLLYGTPYDSTGSCVIVSPEGKTIMSFVNPDLYRFISPNGNTEPISYEEAIILNHSFELSRYNAKENETQWIALVDVLYENMQPDALLMTSVESKNGNIWRYKCDILYYDGSTRQVFFNVNIDTGEIS